MLERERLINEASAQATHRESTGGGERIQLGKTLERPFLGGGAEEARRKTA